MQSNENLQVLVEALNVALTTTESTAPSVAKVYQKIAKVNLLCHFHYAPENLESTKTNIRGLHGSSKLLDYVLVLAEISFSLRESDSLSYRAAVEQLRIDWPTDSLLDSVWSNHGSFGEVSNKSTGVHPRNSTAGSNDDDDAPPERGGS